MYACMYVCMHVCVCGVWRSCWKDQKPVKPKKHVLPGLVQKLCVLSCVTTVTLLPRETDKRNTDSENLIKTEENQTRTKENKRKTRETQGAWLGLGLVLCLCPDCMLFYVFLWFWLLSLASSLCSLPPVDYRLSVLASFLNVLANELSGTLCTEFLDGPVCFSRSH